MVTSLDVSLMAYLNDLENRLQPLFYLCTYCGQFIEKVKYGNRLIHAARLEDTLCTKSSIV